jgi:hypothetical protein
MRRCNHQRDAGDSPRKKFLGFIFTKAAIARIQAMQDSGSTNKEIAAAIGTTEGSLAARVSQLGLSRNPKHAASMRVSFPEQTFIQCAPQAARRNLSASDLIRLLVNRIAQDNLFEAVLDDGDGIS